MCNIARNRSAYHSIQQYLPTILWQACGDSVDCNPFKGGSLNSITYRGTTILAKGNFGQHPTQTLCAIGKPKVGMFVKSQTHQMALASLTCNTYV